MELSHWSIIQKFINRKSQRHPAERPYKIPLDTKYAQDKLESLSADLCLGMNYVWGSGGVGGVEFN